MATTLEVPMTETARVVLRLTEERTETLRRRREVKLPHYDVLLDDVKVGLLSAWVKEPDLNRSARRIRIPGAPRRVWSGSAFGWSSYSPYAGRARDTRRAALVDALRAHGLDDATAEVLAARPKVERGLA